MKKITIFIIVVSLFAACTNGSKTTGKENSGDSTHVESGDQSQDSPAVDKDTIEIEPAQGENPEDDGTQADKGDHAGMAQTAGKSGSGKEKKRYRIKSGIVEFKISGKNISGKKMLYFDKWGMREREERFTTLKMNGEEQKMHDARILKNGWGYIINYDRKELMKAEDPTLKMAGDKDVVEFGEELMTSMGGKKSGKEKVAGYGCDKWDIMGQQTWLHEGVILKTAVELGGMDMTEEAVKVSFNVPVPDDKFVVPTGFKEVKSADPTAGMTEEEFNAELEKMKNLSFEDFKKMMESSGEKIDDMEKAYKEFKDYVNSRK